MRKKKKENAEGNESNSSLDQIQAYLEENKADHSTLR